MSKSAIDKEPSSSEPNVDVPEDELVARIAAGRRSDEDTTNEVDTLLHLAGKKNKAALDRLAK